jgi:hypothetical protein
MGHALRQTVRVTLRQAFLVALSVAGLAGALALLDQAQV